MKPRASRVSRALSIMWRDGWPVPVAVFGLGLALAVAASLGVDDAAAYFRRAGVALQVIGLATVVVGIRSLRRSFRRPPILTRFWAAAKRSMLVLMGRQRAVIVEAPVAAAMSMVAGGVAEVVQEQSPTSLQERLEALERRTEDKFKRIDQNIARVRDEASELKRVLRDERTQRRKATRELQHLLEAAAVGGIDFEGVGAFWLFTGILLAGVPEEIAALLRWLGLA